MSANETDDLPASLFALSYTLAVDWRTTFTSCHPISKSQSNEAEASKASNSNMTTSKDSQKINVLLFGLGAYDRLIHVPMRMMLTTIFAASAASTPSSSAKTRTLLSQ